MANLFGVIVILGIAALVLDRLVIQRRIIRCPRCKHRNYRGLASGILVCNHCGERWIPKKGQFHLRGGWLKRYK